MVTAIPTISISDIGPIETLDIALNPEGGVTVLRGVNGSGKSHALDAISRLGGNSKIKPPIRDGAKRGEVAGCGVHLVVGGKVSHVGELEVESIEGKFDLAKLVDPGIASPESANSARIKQLLLTLNLVAEEASFYDLVGGAEAFDGLAIKPTDDPVELAGRVKRELENRARKLETEAERLAGMHATRLADLQEYGPEVERNATVLNAAVEAAIHRNSVLAEQRRVAVDQSWRRKEAQEKLDKLPSSRVAELLAFFDECQAAEQQQLEKVHVLEDRIKAMQRQLDEERSALTGCKVAANKAYEAYEAEKQRTSDRELFESILAGDTAYMPSDDVIADAQAQLEQARAAAELGTQARLADAKAREAAELKQHETRLRTDANRLREAARGTDEVLSKLVAKLGCDLKVVEGQLCVETDRGCEPYAELSHGERWKLAIQLGQTRVGAGGLLPIAQEAWESLDPANRQIIAEAAHTHRVHVITAEAAAGELRAEAYEDD